MAEEKELTKKQADYKKTLVWCMIIVFWAGFLYVVCAIYPIFPMEETPLRAKIFLTTLIFVCYDLGMFYTLKILGRIYTLKIHNCLV